MKQDVKQHVMQTQIVTTLQLLHQIFVILLATLDRQELQYLLLISLQPNLSTLMMLELLEM